MKLYRYFDFFFKGANQGISVIRGNQPGHILDADTVRAHVLQSPCFFQVVIKVKYFPAHLGAGQGVANGKLRMLAAFLNRLVRLFQVSLVVQGVKYPEYINAHLRRLTNKGGHHIIRVMAVADQVLSAEQHLQRRVRHQFFQDTRPFPGVFIQKPGGHVKSSPTPHLHRIKPGFIHFSGNAHHILGAHPGGQVRLVPVT